MKDSDRFLSQFTFSRRRFIQMVAGLWIEPSLREKMAQAFEENEKKIKLSFSNGERTLVKYPEKRPLIRLTTRPPQLETPFEIFNQGIATPNDAFFVRYHLSGIPTSIDLGSYRISIGGHVNKPLSLSVGDLKTHFKSIEFFAVNQCSGNSRGFFQPRVGGGQLGNGAMGNALWTGVPLASILKKVGISSKVKQISFQGMDNAPIASVPAFVKSLDLEHAMNGDVILAYAMNGRDLPLLNGYPVRLVVPGFYGTYWVKHLTQINALDRNFEGFWMKTAYRVPKNDCSCLSPGNESKETVAIGRLNVRSFITNLSEGTQVKEGEVHTVRGIAFDGGSGIQEVRLSIDGGKTWHSTNLGVDPGKYSFREWSTQVHLKKKGAYDYKIRAINKIGQIQPLTPVWNSKGYMQNGVETVRINCI